MTLLRYKVGDKEIKTYQEALKEAEETGNKLETLFIDVPNDYDLLNEDN